MGRTLPTATLAEIKLMSTLVAAVNVLSSVHALSSDEVLGVDSVSVRVSELDLGERSTSSRIVDDGSDDSLDESVSLSKIVGSECSWSDSVHAVSLVDALGVTLSLC